MNNRILINGEELYKVTEIEGQFIIKYRPLTDNQKAAFNVSIITPRRRRRNPCPLTLLKTSTTTAKIWYARLSHLYLEALSHLNQATEGVIIIGEPPAVVSCEVYALSNTH